MSADELRLNKNNTVEKITVARRISLLTAYAFQGCKRALDNIKLTDTVAMAGLFVFLNIFYILRVPGNIYKALSKIDNPKTTVYQKVRTTLFAAIEIITAVAKILVLFLAPTVLAAVLPLAIIYESAWAIKSSVDVIKKLFDLKQTKKPQERSELMELIKYKSAKALYRWFFSIVWVVISVFALVVPGALIAATVSGVVCILTQVYTERLWNKYMPNPKTSKEQSIKLSELPAESPKDIKINEQAAQYEPIIVPDKSSASQTAPVDSVLQEANSTPSLSVNKPQMI